MAKSGRAEDERKKEDKTEKKAKPAAEKAKPSADKASRAKDALRPPGRRQAAKETTTLAGLVADVFGRRFTLEADGARTLVDLGRRGAALAPVAPGAHVVVTGRRKNGEVKAWALRDEADGRARLLRKEKKARKLAALTPAEPRRDEATAESAAETDA